MSAIISFILMLIGPILAAISILLVVFGSGGIGGLIVSIIGLVSVLSGIVLWIIGEFK